MAQPIFEDDSPLDDYLRDTEIDVMPGILPEFLQPHDVPHDIPHWVPSFILTLCQSLENSLYEPANPITTREFAERFKYIIISSSLLSTFLSPAPTEAHAVPEPETPTVSDANEAPITTSAVLLYIIFPTCLASGYWMLAVVSFTLATVVFKTSTPLSGDKPLQTRLALQSLQGLIEADAAWESAVGEAMELLRRDESSGSMQWHTPLRVGLQSSLQAITTQVDRVRQLFSPLTAPMELAQMTEMYAPPSPTNLHQTLAQQQDSPTSKVRKSPSSSKLDKRITWSGATSKQFFRRSMGPDYVSPDTTSPVPPVPRIPSPGDQDVTFGTLALDLQRNRTTPQRHSMAVTPRSAISLRPSPTAVSRFTTMQSMRNPLSMSSLDSALQAALSSKRYTCAYLLALRFDEEEDDLYWEDVRSVISLLSSSLEDETARLSEAMDDWHKGRQRDARPSVFSTPSPTPSPAESSTPIPIPSSNASQRRRRDVVSFAPQSTDMEKMSGHMQSIAGNLDHAFDELESCVTSLQRYDVTLHNEEDATSSLETSAQAAMSAYEALRRELGSALRECERARGPLLAILSKRSGSAMEMESDDASRMQDGEDESIDQREEDESIDQREEDSFPLDSPTRNGASSPPPAYVSRGPSQIVDDATAHLLAGATALNLPPPGVDKVYEADSGPTVKPYKKERSILSRQERILLAQAKRRSMKSPLVIGAAAEEEPKATSPFALGGEVVEELKEVIKNVNERKQRMAMLPPRRAGLEDSASIFDASLESPGGRTILTSTGSDL